MGLVLELRDRRGVTVLLSSHLLHQVQEICDRVGIFVAGRLAAVGRVDDLVAEASDRWVLELEIDGEEERVLRAITSVRGANASQIDGRWRVTGRRDLRHDLVSALVREDCIPTMLTRREADLDAIYHRYFMEATHGDGR
jgi:ABC-2 type transport system ATP-binding protein